MILKNLHLILSSIIVIPVAIVYGFCPHLLFQITINSINEHSIFKAIMGLYLAFGLLFILGICYRHYWKTATQVNILFMFSLAFGRIISFVFDGFPSPVFLFGTLGELILGFYGLLQLKQHSIKS
ncbi:MAG: DUF4345 domain-containing protein [Flavobacterium sp.]|nr:DUF4345 domain-containing protein [Flavobacterium sp.]